MHPNDLKLGDIIAFHAPDGVAEHAAMYTGNIEGKPYITHPVTDANPGLKTTILKNLGSLEYYTVYRPVNAELGAKAAQRMLDWAKYHIPYDQRRAKWMHRTNNLTLQDAQRANKADPLGVLLDFLKQESQNKFYERIKFAARRDTCPVKLMADILTSRGFTCIQAIILAYQVEEIAPWVKTLYEIQLELAREASTVEEITELWISVKHCLPEVQDTYVLPESYVRYFTQLREKEEFNDFYIDDKRDTPCHPHYHPSLVAWRYDLEPSIDAFRAKFTSCFELPAKICYTDGLLEYMNRDSKHWINMGLMNPKELPREFTPEEKQLHRKRTSDLSAYIEVCRHGATRKLSSPHLLFNASASASASRNTSRSVSPWAESFIDTHEFTDGDIDKAGAKLATIDAKSPTLHFIDSPFAASQFAQSPLLSRMYSKKLSSSSELETLSELTTLDLADTTTGAKLGGP